MNNPTTTQAQITPHVTGIDLRGEGGEATVTSFQQADLVLGSWAAREHPSGGYCKTWYTVTASDGSTYNGRIDLLHRYAIQTDILQAAMAEHLTWISSDPPGYQFTPQEIEDAKDALAFWTRLFFSTKGGHMADETVTLRLTGNGLVMERTELTDKPVPWWWISDERRVTKAQSQTYRHRETLKTYGCRWSKRRQKWYYIGVELPEEITALVGPQGNTGEPVASHIPVPDEPVAAPHYSPRLTGSATAVREAYQQRVLRRFAEQFQADLDRITRYPALPAVATIRLDDPWS